MFGKDTVVTGIKLFIITAVAALCLAVAYRITAPIINENQEKLKVESRQEVLPEALEFAPINEIPEVEIPGVDIVDFFVGKDEEGTVGYVVTAVSHEGYGGDIKVMVGIDADFAVKKISILESSETAGLGAKAKTPGFSNQYVGKSGSLSVVKSEPKENEIMAISSATVTSKAVTACVNGALEAVEKKVADLAELEKIADEKDKIDKASQDVINGEQGGAQ